MGRLCHDYAGKPWLLGDAYDCASAQQRDRPSGHHSQSDLASQLEDDWPILSVSSLLSVVLELIFRVLSAVGFNNVVLNVCKRLTSPGHGQYTNEDWEAVREDILRVLENVQPDGSRQECMSWGSSTAALPSATGTEDSTCSQDTRRKRTGYCGSLQQDDMGEEFLEYPEPPRNVYTPLPTICASVATW
ncbi:MAG: hypothetical protein M1833_000344 [Piccolia ochrophora]|nr:MAG: hypothetical protein M1833_000344 [Piccolia ochrophora]